VVEPLGGHTDSVESVAFSPDGTRIVSGSYDETIRIWDAQTGEEVVEPLKGHTGEIRSVAFSPDGTRVVSGSYDMTIRIWDAQTGQEVANPLKGHTDVVPSVAFSSDRTRIVAGSALQIPDLMAGEAVMSASQSIPTLTHLFGTSSGGTTISNHMLFHSCHASSGAWIEGPAKELIFWVLPEWRTFVVWPPCLSLIAESRIIVDLQYFVHGTDWTRCLASP
jgi:WD40 repeat protein